MAGNNNNKRFPGAEELEGIDLRNLDNMSENFHDQELLVAYTMLKTNREMKIKITQ